VLFFPESRASGNGRARIPRPANGLTNMETTLDIGLVHAQLRNWHPATDAMGGVLSRTDRNVHNQETKIGFGQGNECQGNIALSTIPVSDPGTGFVLPLFSLLSPVQSEPGAGANRAKSCLIVVNRAKKIIFLLGTASVAGNVSFQPMCAAENSRFQLPGSSSRPKECLALPSDTLGHAWTRSVRLNFFSGHYRDRRQGRTKLADLINMRINALKFA